MQEIEGCDNRRKVMIFIAINISVCSPERLSDAYPFRAGYIIYSYEDHDFLDNPLLWLLPFLD